MAKGNAFDVSATSFMRVAACLAGLTDSQASDLLANPTSVLKNLEPASEIEALFNEVKGLYSDNELAAWLKLLRPKHQVASDIGISLKASIKSTKKIRKQRFRN